MREAASEVSDGSCWPSSGLSSVCSLPDVPRVEVLVAEGFSPGRLAGEPAPAVARVGCDVSLEDLTVELVRD